jgi:TetR/AcrR family transcriptional repressor of nem operon
MREAPPQARTEQLLDAAERRIREAGYNGFSFRDLAAEVGIKSASVHHHFPTKARLAAAVARRYADRFLAALGPPEAGSVAAFRRSFAEAFARDGGMCLCGVLAAEAGALPPEVAAEARRFFEGSLAHLLRLPEITAEPVPTRRALFVLATLEGAMLLARVMPDPATFEHATAGLVEA